jgi:hypothetical protein
MIPTDACTAPTALPMPRPPHRHSDRSVWSRRSSTVRPSRRDFTPSRPSLTSPSFRPGHHWRRLSMPASSAVSPFLAPFNAPSSCRRSSAVARGRAGAIHRAVELPVQRCRRARSRRSHARLLATRPGRPKQSSARPWAMRVLRRPAAPVLCH